MNTPHPYDDALDHSPGADLIAKLRGLFNKAADANDGDYTRKFNHALVAVYAYGRRRARRAWDTRSATGESSRDDVLKDVEHRLQMMCQLQRDSAWPHVEGVERARRMVRQLRADGWKPTHVHLDTGGLYRLVQSVKYKAAKGQVAFCPVSAEGCMETPVCPWPCKKLKPRAPQMERP